MSETKKGEGNRVLNLCMVGCGGFADFTLEEYGKIEGLKIQSLVDTDSSRLKTLKEKYGISRTFNNLNEALSQCKPDLAVIATPPYLHFEQTMAALNAGVHVFCEKPFAMTRLQAEEIIETAEGKGLKVFCNYVMRYNPMFRLLGYLVKSGCLGPVSCFTFRNYAQDEGLSGDHWFWDRKKSGGIFIEHGVHFFDIMNGILGKGKHGQSFVVPRSPGGREDRVMSTVIYPGSIPGNFYHGFTQKSPVERNYMQVTFKKGYVTLHEWMPTCMTGEIWVTAGEYVKFHEAVFDIMPEYTDLTLDGSVEKMDDEVMEFPDVCIHADEILEIEEKSEQPDLEVKWGPNIKCRHYVGDEGEWFNFSFSTRVEEGKMPLYRECVKKCMEDFVLGIRDPLHKTAFACRDMADSVEIAEDSADKAQILSY